MCSAMERTRFLAKYGHTLSREQRQVLRAVIRCRTAELGGHVQQVRRLRSPADSVQFLPQPTLPQVPGDGPGCLVGETRK